MVDIKGYEGLYAATEDGQIWSHRRQIFLKPHDNGHGYLHVILCKDGNNKHYRVNRLIAEAYLPNPDNLPEVGHRNNIRNDNELSNLYWTDRQTNLDTDSFREKSRKKIFSKIRCVETGEIFDSQAAAARAYGIHYYGINSVLMGKQKTAAGYHWERVIE